MKIMLKDFNEKLGREDNFKPTIGSESLHQDSNENDVRIIRFFFTSKHLVLKSMMFLHCNIRK